MKFLKWIRQIIVGLFFLSILSTITYKWVPVPFTELMLKRYFINGNSINKKWVSINKISKNMPLAVIASEDQNFLTHNGFEFTEILQAIHTSSKKGKPVRGASTISQQTAKNVFLWNDRSYIRKGLEVYFTFLIELVWGKKRIMEVYLNIAEFGEGIYGVEAASRFYFNKSANTLTKAESATLAALLPKPRDYGKKIRKSYIQKRKKQILHQMNNIENRIFIR